ncbi:hypothetical protein HJC23_010788 [Cyclotella cryptica]|uniref:Uncharacterized protein n=1 Tax=Cyclotella cryptica TaxID=29204 RepID=A0ABD3NJ23_9STRA|eukprot:CCRYP_021050-RA/>CCRYP_021050-RA protein AED:0.33 eAED:0.33 QI:905/1/1/1/0/0/2/337/704
MDATNNSPPRPTTEKQATTNQQETAAARGHNRTHTPFESPARASSSRPPIPSTPGGSTHALLHPPSTPGQNFHGFVPGTPNYNSTNTQNPHGSSKFSSELDTPVISNANVTYVDDDHDGIGVADARGGHPAQLGLGGGRGVGRNGNPGIPFGDSKSTNYGIPLSKSLAPRTNSHGRLLGARPPQPFVTKGSRAGGLGVMTSLAMPSALQSDDSSLEEENIIHASPTAIVGGPAAQDSVLRPIELKPNRFHSFQGSSQYERSIPGRNVHFVKFGRGNENSSSRRTTNLSPAREHPYPTPTHVAATTTGQYFPTVRGAHGVRELSDTKDLDAIFKADRTATGTMSGPPSSVAKSTASSMNPKIVSPMSVDDSDDDDDVDEEEEQRQESSSFHPLGGGIPIDDRQWSIPSIRLANHVNASGLDGSVTSYHTLFSDDEDYTDDGGSSFDGSFLGCEDDDVSLSSKESYDQVRRWRRLSGVLRRGGVPLPVTALMGDDEDVAMIPPPHVLRAVPTTSSDLDVPNTVPIGGGRGGISLLEQRFGQIAIDSKELSSNPSKEPSTLVHTSPLILDPDASLQSIDDNAIDYHKDTTDGVVRARPSVHRHRRHKKKGRSRSHSAAALEWIQNLQQSNAIEGSRITEAASSKFLTGALNKVEPLEVAVSQDATKALGMPHPLCRSTTIEAGGFAYDLRGGKIESAMLLMDDGESR